MRVAIAVASTLTLAAAAAAAMVLHTPASKPGQHGAAVESEAPTDAEPGLVWRSGSATLTLTERACPSAELVEALEPEGISRARAYEVVQGSKRYIGCWTKDVGGDVVTIEPGREIGSIPVAWFRHARNG